MRYISLKQWRKNLHQIKDSSDNRSAFVNRFLDVHDKLMMLHMQAYGFG